MHYSKIKWNCKDVVSLKIYKGSLRSRYEKVVRSLADFFEEQDVVAFREQLTQGLQDLEVLRKEIPNGRIERVPWNGDCTERNVLEQAQSSFQQFCSIEDKVKQRCVKNWNRYLTSAEEWEIGKEYSKGAFLVQAVEYGTSIVRILKGPAVSASLVTSGMQYLYKQRRIGVLYRLTENNLLTMNTSDLYSDLKELSTEADVVDSLFHWDLLSSTFGLSLIDSSDSKFYKFREFVKQWEERVKQAETEDHYNEVLLIPNFENDLMGAFYLSSASDGEKDRAAKLAELTTGVLIEMRPDGCVRRVK